MLLVSYSYFQVNQTHLCSKFLVSNLTDNLFIARGTYIDREITMNFTK